MRVVLASPRAVAGGAQAAAAGLARGLVPRGFEVDVVLGEDGPLAAWAAEAGGDVTVLPGPPPRGWRPNEAAVARVDRLVRARRPGAVLGLCSAGHLLAGPAAARAGVPAVWWRMLTARRRPHELAAARVPAAAVMCPTAAAARDQRALTPAARCWYVPLGAPIDAIAARRGAGAAVRRALGWDGQRIVGMVARLDPAKGQDVFLRAAAHVAERFEDARFLIAGGALVGHEGAFPAELESLAGRLGLGSRVAFTGFVDDPVPYVDALDVAVSASAHEAFGLAMVEALALGVPVVATRTQGPAEILGGGRHGLLVSPGDTGALAAAISRVLLDRRLAASLSAAGPVRAARFTEAAMGERVAHRLRSLPRAPAAGEPALAPRHYTF